MARVVGERFPPLLAGEKPDGTIGTARRWLVIYDDLLRFVERALSEPSRDDALRTSLMRKRREFRRRLVYWEGELRRVRLERSHFA
jgi:hypothetical protein